MRSMSFSFYVERLDFSVLAVGGSVRWVTGRQNKRQLSYIRKEEDHCRGCKLSRAAGLLMIRNVLVMAKSGLVLFSREFANSVQQVPVFFLRCREHIGCHTYIIAFGCKVVKTCTSSPPPRACCYCKVLVCLVP